MKKNKFYDCWRTSTTEIQDEANKHYEDNPPEFTEEEFDEIARIYRKGIEYGVEDVWEDAMKAAIEQVMQNRKSQGTRK